METYYGHVRTPADAIKLFEACRLGLLPRVQRRLSEKERQSIKSGSVFVWDEREAGMRRWTDGKSWSASRVSGSFLTYREMEGKRGGGQFVPPPVRRVGGKTPDSGRGSDEDMDLDGEGPDGYRYKPDGLMKQSFSITTSTGQHLHLISYYSRPHPNAPDIPQPTSDLQLRHIIPVKGMYPESTIHEPQGPSPGRASLNQSPYLQQSPHQPHHSPNQRPPPHQYVAQGYAWPPSPMSTPPFPHYPGPIYNPAASPPGPAPYQHHYLNSLPPNSLHHHQHQPPIYDRPPPHLSETSLPPPPPPMSHRGMSTATAQNLMPLYAPNPSPRVAQARIIAEQAQVAQRALQSGAPMLDPRLMNPLNPIQQQSNQRLPPVQLSAIHIPPRSTTPPRSTSAPRTGTPTTANRPASPKDTSPKNNGASQAQSIPSISHLVHATDSVSVMSDNKSNSSRAGSKSPPRESGVTSGSLVNGEQKPKDIPHEKLNILGEDQRAIRVLDRKFCI